jgi:integrase
LEGYRRQIDQRIIPALGRIPVRRLDVETLDGFYAELRQRGKAGGEPLSASTVRAVHTVLSGSLRQAVARGWIPHNPARLATPPSGPRSDVAPPPVEQVAGLLATALARNPRLGLFLGWRWRSAPAEGSCARCAGGTSTWTAPRCYWSAAWCT